MQYSKPETFRNLTDRRIILNENLSAMYSLPPGEQRAYLLAHPELEIDKAEADAIRDVVYPEIDDASGPPLGTTAKLQQRRGAIMGLSNTVQKHLDQLEVKTKTLAGLPVWERGNISTYGTTSGRPGVAVHRLSSLLRTPNPEAAANKRVASAFGHTVGSKIATPLATKPGMDVMALPFRYLAAPERRSKLQKKRNRCRRFQICAASRRLNYRTRLISQDPCFLLRFFLYFAAI